MKCYLFTWHRYIGDDQFDRKELLNYLDTIPEVVNWRTSAGAVLIASDLTADDLEKKIHAKFPGLFFIVALITIQTIDGRNDQASWDFIRSPKPAG
jgi:hypothetical protein